MRNIVQLLDLNRSPGLIGLEVEIEGSCLPTVSHSPWWRREEDHSLRGAENAEYVLKRPVEKKDLLIALLDLYSALEKTGASWHSTGRAGTHVHINCQTLTPSQLLSYIAFFIAVEEVFIEFSGEVRKGNHFCLSSYDAEGTYKAVCDLAAGLYEGERSFFVTLLNYGTDRYRYSCVNLRALVTYGSLEFRSLPSPISLEKLRAATEFLTTLQEIAIEHGALTKETLPFEKVEEVVMKYLQPHLEDEAFDIRAALLKGWERASLIQNISIYGGT